MLLSFSEIDDVAIVGPQACEPKKPLPRWEKRLGLRVMDGRDDDVVAL